MNTSFPAKLEIVSLTLAQKSDDDFLCSISLIKGMQNFGQIKFQIDKEYTEYTFSDQKIIKFFYAPRLTTRKDVYFKIKLTDLESKQQMGQITISMIKLAQTFQKDGHAVIEETREFFEGVSLTYKIYQPVLELQIGEKSTGFNDLPSNDFISNLFARPEPESMAGTSRVEKKMSGTQKIKQTISIMKQEQPPKKVQQSSSLIQLFIKPPPQQQPLFKMTDSQVESHPPTSSNQPGSQTSILHTKPSTNPHTNMNLSTADLHSSQLLNRMFALIRQSTYQTQKKKHTIAGKVAEHHGETKLSVKLKIVIFLLVFGFFMTVFDVYQDKQEEKIIKKIKKSAKTTKTTKSKHDH